MRGVTWSLINFLLFVGCHCTLEEGEEGYLVTKQFLVVSWLSFYPCGGLLGQQAISCCLLVVIVPLRKVRRVTWSPINFLLFVGCHCTLEEGEEGYLVTNQFCVVCWLSLYP